MYPSIFKVWVAVSLTAALSSSATPPPLTGAEASAIVRSQLTAERSAELDRRRRLLEVDAVGEAVAVRGANKIRLRRIAPRHLEVAPSKREAASPKRGKPETVGTGASAESLRDYRQETISIAATVFDDTYTRITWREPGVSGADPITVWTNANLKYLRPISNWEDDGIHYGYFGMTAEVDTDASFTHPGTGEKIRPATIPEWIPQARDFPGGEPGYLIVVDEAGAKVPKRLYRQMDALLRYYAAHEPELIDRHRRSAALREAKAEYLEKNPAPKKDVIINYWPIRSNADI